MATQTKRVEDWRNRVVNWLEASKDLYDIVNDYSSLGGQEWLEATATEQSGAGLIEGMTDLTVGQVVAIIVSIGAIKTAVEGGFHDDNLIKARS